MQETLAQLPEPYKVVVIQPPVYYGMTVPTLAPDQVQHLPSVTVQPLKLKLTKTPGATIEAEHPTAPKTTTALQPGQVHAQHPNLTTGTVQPLNQTLTQLNCAKGTPPFVSSVPADMRHCHVLVSLSACARVQHLQWHLHLLVRTVLPHSSLHPSRLSW